MVAQENSVNSVSGGCVTLIQVLSLKWLIAEETFNMVAGRWRVNG